MAIVSFYIFCLLIASIKAGITLSNKELSNHVLIPNAYMNAGIKGLNISQINNRFVVNRNKILFY